MRSILLFVACAMAFNFALGQPNWTETAEPKRNNRVIIPADYLVYHADFQSIKDFLSLAPERSFLSVRNSDFILEIPSPTGEMITFRVVEHSIMEPGLQAQYPYIRTFAGQGIGENKSATAKFDFTTKGFHAQIISPEGTYYIDPYSPVDLDNYIVYTKKSFYKTKPQHFRTCNPIGDDDQHPFETGAIPVEEKGSRN